ncbi:MAG: hypothetical protein ACW98D_21435 [Promethearchaeota archaeon]|jgi:hypothetical protein
MEYKRKIPKKEMKELQCLFAWSFFYTDKSGGTDSKGEPISRMRYRSDLYEKYQKVQEQIKEISNRYK